MGLARWFFYGTNSWHDQDAKREIDRGTPSTLTRKAVMRQEQAAERRRRNRRAKRR